MKRVRICHFSDWHGETMQLPWADVYVCTGDVLDNWPLGIYSVVTEEGAVHVTADPSGPPIPGLYIGRKIDPERERIAQAAFCDQGLWRSKCLGEDDRSKPVVVVRGNHDFCDLAPYFAGGEVHEVTDDPSRVFEVCGLKFGGFRGIPAIDGLNEWSDEKGRLQLDELCERLPSDIDVLITHCPPLGTLDSWSSRGGRTRLGSPSLASYVHRRSYGKQLKAHLFGHIHESHGTIRKGDIIFSNAATTYNLIELEVEE